MLAHEREGRRNTSERILCVLVDLADLPCDVNWDGAEANALDTFAHSSAINTEAAQLVAQKKKSRRKKPTTDGVDDLSFYCCS